MRFKSPRSINQPSILATGSGSHITVLVYLVFASVLGLVSLRAHAALELVYSGDSPGSFSVEDTDNNTVFPGSFLDDFGISHLPDISFQGSTPISFDLVWNAADTTSVVYDGLWWDIQVVVVDPAEVYIDNPLIHSSPDYDIIQTAVAADFSGQPTVSAPISLFAGVLEFNGTTVANGTVVASFDLVSVNPGPGNHDDNADLALQSAGQWQYPLLATIEPPVFDTFTLPDPNSPEVAILDHITGNPLPLGGPTQFFDVQTTVVPVPAAAWLFGSALIGLIGLSRRRLI